MVSRVVSMQVDIMQKLQDSVHDFVGPPAGDAAKQRVAKKAVEENRVCNPCLGQVTDLRWTV